MLKAYERLVDLYDNEGKILLRGNGRSNVDALHIAGELCKSFEAKRPVPPGMVKMLSGLPHGDQLSAHLEVGFAAIPLGLNTALKTAVENDRL